jgi:acid phosphatase type 7
MRRRLAVPAMLAILAGCGAQGTEESRPPNATPSASVAATADPPPSQSAPEEAVLIAAGDIADCEDAADEQTAALIEDMEGTVATLGDNVYPFGSDQLYADCFGPTWGQFMDRLRPAIGNHDDDEDGGASYYRYFGDLAGNAGEGWYSYDLGTWHVIVLNSNCGDVACEPGSPQHEWLVEDLAASDAGCTLAYWHHPRFSSGEHGGDPDVAPFWEALYEADADVVLAAHDHIYERFAPQAPDGSADPERGIRQITAGTGGKSLYAIEHHPANSEVIINDMFGVLELTLRADGYDWRFVSVDSSELDAGTGECH